MTTPSKQDGAAARTTDREANARLISAAPEMLEALREVLKFKQGVGKYNFRKVPESERDDAYWDGWYEVEGKWEAACCNGADGCSCRGDVVPMGPCLVCQGQGAVDVASPLYNPMANVESIRGALFLGSGPRGGYFGKW